MLYERTIGLVSVVVTCHNISSFIKECLDGLLKQTYRNIEVILVNDASLDNTSQVIKEWIEENNPPFSVELINLPWNVGFAGASTIGYFLTKGEYIAVHDGDDISHPERLEKQVSYLQNHPEIDVLGSSYAYFHDGNFQEFKKENWLRYGKNIRELYAKGGHCVCHGTLLFRGEVFDKIGGPTRRIKGAEDYEFIAKCLNAKLNVENLPDVLYYYRFHSKQRSQQFYRKEAVKDE
ncbi:glycosyltransferase family 2 protein [Priestia megaterium]|uniref:glycosyltransferase family 2 protein n=1 Tax=Priestia megaterium TaxID=1404 RepID=UPI000D51F0B1|nr:glycosyltransferase family 2 protein [Priestia megaterium]PVE74493.1 glycosyl transferase [Priestia megaterium]PVE82428.1 glycosyl transferase [Priestia megaterium]PVE87014.1 glycosyl transferase [Priestia megaterium]PVE94545.1 glycosyl transferase [Priestia megaterium]